MAADWLAIRVELLGGRGDDLWPPPGRQLVVGQKHTFAQLAEAIDDAFARWDLAHLRAFTLPDGRTVTDPETAGEMAASAFGRRARRRRPSTRRWCRGWWTSGTSSATSSTSATTGRTPAR